MTHFASPGVPLDAPDRRRVYTPPLMCSQTQLRRSSCITVVICHFLLLHQIHILLQSALLSCCGVSPDRGNTSRRRGQAAQLQRWGGAIYNAGRFCFVDGGDFSDGPANFSTSRNPPGGDGRRGAILFRDTGSAYDSQVSGLVHNRLSVSHVLWYMYIGT